MNNEQPTTPEVRAISAAKTDVDADVDADADPDAAADAGAQTTVYSPAIFLNSTSPQHPYQHQHQHQHPHQVQ